MSGTVTKRWFWGPTTYGTGDTYVVQTADLSHQIYCEVTETPGGFSELSDPFPDSFYTDPGAPEAPPCHSSTPSEATFSDALNDPDGPAPDISSVHVGLDASCTLTLAVDFASGPSPGLVTFDLDVDGSTATGSTNGDDVSVLLGGPFGNSPAYARIDPWNPARRQFDLAADTLPVQVWNAQRVSFSVPVTKLGIIPGATAHVLAEAAVPGGTDRAPQYNQAWFPFSIAYSSTPPAAPPAPPNVTPPVTTAVKIAAPALRHAPKVTRKGSRLTCSPGTWSGSPTLSYAWKRDGKRLKGQAKSRYTLRQRDRRHRLACTVTASNAGGSKSATSRALRVK